jgi:hypothetical protein
MSGIFLKNGWFIPAAEERSKKNYGIATSLVSCKT